MPRILRWSFVFAWMWPARLAFGGAFAAWMTYEWKRWPNGSPFFGPIGMIWYGGASWASLILCAISLAMLLAFLLKPHTSTAVISVVGTINWLFWGVMADGIGC